MRPSKPDDLEITFHVGRESKFNHDSLDVYMIEDWKHPVVEIRRFRMEWSPEMNHIMWVKLRWPGYETKLTKDYSSIQDLVHAEIENFPNLFTDLI